MKKILSDTFSQDNIIAYTLALCCILDVTCVYVSVCIFQNNTKKVDLEYFKDLCIDYYRSDEPSALGNFITGKLDFND